MQEIDGRKILLAVLFVLILIVVTLLVGRISYGYLAPNIDDEDVVSSGEVTANGDVLIFRKGDALSLKATTENFYTSKGNLTSEPKETKPSVTLKAKKTLDGTEPSATATYNVGVNIESNSFVYTTDTNTAELILTVRDETGAVVDSANGLNFVEVNGISGFDVTGKQGVFSIFKDHTISSNNSNTGNTHTWTFSLTFINFDTDQSLNENAALDLKIIMQAEEIVNSTVTPPVTS